MTNESTPAKDVAAIVAQLFALAGGHVSFYVPNVELEVAGMSPDPKSGLLAAAVAVRRALCQSAQGRQALRDLGFEPVEEDAERE